MPALGSWSQGTHWSQGLGWCYIAVFWGDSPPSYPLLSHKISRRESVPLPFRVSEGWWRMGPHSACPSWHGPPHKPVRHSQYRPPWAARAAPLQGDRGGGSATSACAPWGLREAFVNNDFQPLPFLPAAWNCVAV